MMMNVVWGNGGENDDDEKDEVHNFYCVQLCFARSKVPIGVGILFLKINIL